MGRTVRRWVLLAYGSVARISHAPGVGRDPSWVAEARTLRRHDIQATGGCAAPGDRGAHIETAPLYAPVRRAIGGRAGL
ncbi:hypothetical protein GCM10018785_00930 [Streptomyces longispororuber]|uniref:Uncharacterized protein n=1 Tax=Streptomyces longispororuber TaxID=68230 RepID=A0A918Z3B5_9ACTN|nr:hypothetical protein GCM10018785_00930 [Streptomyces longispororuber]